MDLGVHRQLEVKFDLCVLRLFKLHLQLENRCTFLVTILLHMRLDTWYCKYLWTCVSRDNLRTLPHYKQPSVEAPRNQESFAA